MKKIVLLAAVVFCCSLLHAQDEDEATETQKDKFFAGGNFGLTFGTYTLINVSPQVGYRFNKFLSAGLGINLQYASFKERDFYGNDFRKEIRGITGLNLFTRFYPAQQFMIQVQPEANYIFGKQIFYQPAEATYKLDTEIVPSLLLGGGYVMPAGNGAVMTTIMYDVLQRPGSPYGNRPIVNVGYNFSF